MSKSTIVLFQVTFVIVSLVLTACGRKIEGVVTLKGSQPISLLDVSGKKIELHEGPATLALKGVSKQRLEITSLGETIRLALPKKIISGGIKNGFYLPGSKTGQEVDLEGAFIRELLGVYESQGSLACRGPGYCYDPYSGPYPHPTPYPPHSYPPGQYPNPPVFGWFPDCPGYQWVTFVYQDVRETYLVNFINPTSRDKDILGQLKSEQGTHRELVDTIPQTGCVVN